MATSLKTTSRSSHILLFGVIHETAAGMLRLCLAVFLCTAAQAFPEIPQKVLENITENYLVPVFRYENPVDRDHFIHWGALTNLKFSDFNFENYRFDGYVATVLLHEGYKIVIDAVPEAESLFQRVFHGYHKSLKHNYLSKAWEPYFEGPLFYCSRKKGFMNATIPLWTLDGQPIDQNGNLGYDTIYTSKLVERDQPNFEDYVMYRVLCYTWEEEDNLDLKFKTDSEESKDVPIPLGNMEFEEMQPVYQFYNEHDQDHYYKLKYEQNAEDHANYINVVAATIKNESLQIKHCNAGTNESLLPLVQAYDARGTNHVLFVGYPQMKEVEKTENIKFENVTVLGYVARNNVTCKGRYQLNIRVRTSDDLYHKDNSTQQGQDYHDKDVYLAPNNYKTEDPLYYGQTFFVW